MRLCLKTLYYCLHRRYATDRRSLVMTSRRATLLLGVLMWILVVTGALVFCKCVEARPDPTLLRDDISSVRNPIVEFTVDAETKNGDFVKVTNEGGLVYLKRNYFNVVPWKVWYDEGRKAWIAFLINVTTSNFRVSYMFLRNGTGAFTLWHYDYEASSYDGYLFYGADYIKNKTCLSPSVRMPKLGIIPEARVPSQISALGPTLYIDDEAGLYLDAGAILSVYPIRADAGQTWFLMLDRQGRYYFSIFYYFESDREHVVRGHTVRLNDLYQPPFEYIPALWTSGRFPYSLTVTCDIGNLTVRIGGFPFKTNEHGRIVARVPMGDISVEAQNEITISQGSRRIFNEWKWLTKSNPTIVRITRDTDLYLTYRNQFYLSLWSPYGSPLGEGWYDAGATARFSVEPVVSFPNGTKHVFLGWGGAKETSRPEDTVVVDGPKTLWARWKRQYEIVISTKGLPSGSTLNLTVNENQTSVVVPFKHRQWVDAGSELSVKISPMNVSSFQGRYVFRRWQTGSDEPLLLPIVVRGPTQLIARYETEEPFTGKVTLEAAPLTLLVEDTVTVRGATSPSRPLTTVAILWSQDSIEWAEIANVTTNAEGSYMYVWQVPQGQKFYLKAKWIYDPDYAPIESPIAVVTRVSSGQRSRWPQLLNGIAWLIENLPIPSKAAAILMIPLTKVNEAVAPVSVLIGGPQWLQETTLWVMTGMVAGPFYLAPMLTLFVLAWKKFANRLPTAKWLIMFVTATSAGIGFTMIGQVLSASTIIQVGLAFDLVFSSLLTSYAVAFAIAKIR